MDLLQKDGYRLRAPEPEDLDCMLQFENTPTLWTVSNATGPYSRFHLKQYLETNKNDLYADGQLRLMIESPEKEVVGIIDLFNFDAFHNRAEVGIVVSKNYQNRGIAQRALALLIKHAFDFLGLHQLYAYTDETNHPCRHLFRKAGFEACACLKEWMRTGTTYRDVIMFQLLNINS